MSGGARERFLPLAGVVLLCGLAWAYLVVEASGMAGMGGAMDGMEMSAMPGMEGMAGGWSGAGESGKTRRLPAASGSHRRSLRTSAALPR